jgi:two-component system sensor histidine kinase CpxA
MVGPPDGLYSPRRTYVKSIYAKIVLSSFVVLALSFLLFVVIVRSNSARAFHRGGAFGGLLDEQSSEASRQYDRGGNAALAAYLSSVAREYPGTTRFYLDPNGRDLLTGADHSRDLAAARSGWNRFRFLAPIYVAQPTGDGRHILLFAPSASNLVNSLFLYYFLLLAAIVVLCSLLGIQFVSPLNRLTETVRRFGAGELAVRVELERGDELGELSRAFDLMASRIETLLTAERRLLQDISHELRSPLARLSFAAELARTSPDRDAAIARMNKEIKRLTELIGSLIQVTRVEGDPAARNLEPVPVGDMISELVEDGSIEADARGCRLVVRGSGNPVLPGDRELLRRALENILRNAIRHAPEQTDVEIVYDSSPANMLISIRDYGSGVPADSLKAIFQPFFRVDDSRSMATGGLGLGLAIAERAIRAHHGNLWAENAAPGLRVCLDLPVGRFVPPDGPQRKDAQEKLVAPTGS